MWTRSRGLNENQIKQTWYGILFFEEPVYRGDKRITCLPDTLAKQQENVVGVAER